MGSTELDEAGAKTEREMKVCMRLVRDLLHLSHGPIRAYKVL